LLGGGVFVYPGVMTRTQAIIAAILLPLTLLFAPAPVAQAVTCIPGTSICQGGDVRHANDSNYDPAIVVFCDYGDAFDQFGNPNVSWNQRELVQEGTTSHADCGDDTDVVYVRAGEEIWCDSGNFGPYKWLDATGPHKINDLADRTCTLRKD
jgi:hypothetical protein